MIWLWENFGGENQKYQPNLVMKWEDECFEMHEETEKMEKEAVVSSQKIDVEDAPYLRLIIESIRRTA
jgi:hypothetical protein